MHQYPALKPGQLILVTGPARSGKSAWAEALAIATQQSVIYVATGSRTANDPEWNARIEAHRQRRPQNWQTLEVPTDLESVLLHATEQTCLLIDSLGTWLANHIETDRNEWEKIAHDFWESLKKSEATVILVAEETGWGIVPAYPMGRTFRDRLGQLAQDIARRADYVYLVTAGIALNLKELGTFIPD